MDTSSVQIIKLPVIGEFLCYTLSMRTRTAILMRIHIIMKRIKSWLQTLE